MNARFRRRPAGLMLCLLSLAAVVALAQAGFQRQPAFFTHVGHYPNRPGSYSIRVEGGVYHSILVSGEMLRAVEHRGNYYRATHCDACYCWETGDRPRPRNNDPMNPRPWRSAPQLVPGMVSNNLGLDMCQQTPYNEQHLYWSGWFLPDPSAPLVVSHNVAAHPRNTTSLTFFVGNAPRGTNPVGVWEFRNNAWINTANGSQAFGNPPLGPAPGRANDDNGNRTSLDLFSSDYSQPQTQGARPGSVVMGFDEYAEGNRQRADRTAQPPVQPARPNQVGKSRDECIREICPACAQSVGLLGQYADPRCQTCVESQAARIQACMTGGQTSGNSHATITNRCALVPGTWRWFTGRSVRVDNRFFSNATGIVAEWTCQDPAGVIEVRWRTGGWIDTLRLSPDGRRLDGTNQRGGRVSGTR